VDINDWIDRSLNDIPGEYLFQVLQGKSL